jgi:hypothetical protein
MCRQNFLVRQKILVKIGKVGIVVVAVVIVVDIVVVVVVVIGLIKNPYIFYIYYIQTARFTQPFSVQKKFYSNLEKNSKTEHQEKFNN